MSTHMLIPVIFYTITRSIPCNIVPCIIVSANRREQEYIVTQEPLCFVCVDESYTGAFCTHISEWLLKPRFATHCASGYVDMQVLLFNKHIKAYSSYI